MDDGKYLWQRWMRKVNKQKSPSLAPSRVVTLQKVVNKKVKHVKHFEDHHHHHHKKHKHTNAVAYPVYSTVSLVPYNVLTTVAAFTVPAKGVYQVTGFVGSGDVNAWFQLFINGSPLLSGRSTVAQQTVEVLLSDSAPFLGEGSTIQIKVSHSAAGIQANFEGTILGNLEIFGGQGGV